MQEIKKAEGKRPKAKTKLCQNKKQNAKGKRQEAKGKGQNLKGKRQKVNGKRQNFAGTKKQKAKGKTLREQNAEEQEYKQASLAHLARSSENFPVDQPPQPPIMSGVYCVFRDTVKRRSMF